MISIPLLGTSNKISVGVNLFVGQMTVDLLIIYNVTSLWSKLLPHFDGNETSHYYVISIN